MQLDGVSDEQRLDAGNFTDMASVRKDQSEMRMSIRELGIDILDATTVRNALFPPALCHVPR